MNDKTTRLDEIERRLSQATPGPWEAYGTTIAAMTGPGDCGGCSGLPSPAHEPACLWSEIAGADEPDAELIAHAPADLAALLAVVREVAAANGRYMLGTISGVSLSVDIHAALGTLTGHGGMLGTEGGEGA